MTVPTPELPSALSPELLARLAAFGPVLGARPLVGGRSAHTFAVEHERAVTVVHLRSGGPDALAREAAAGVRAHAAGVGPEVLDVVAEFGALVTRWVPGPVLVTADFRDDVILREVASSVRRLHDAPPAPKLVPHDALDFRRRYLDEARTRGLTWPPEVEAELERTDRLAAALTARAGEVVPVGCHVDLVPANLVRSSRGIVLLDHEWAGLADPALDLGGLATTAELDDDAMARLVAAYIGYGGTSVTLDRVRAWRDVTRHAWFVWMALGEDLGPERARWDAWAERVRAGWAYAARSRP